MKPNQSEVRGLRAILRLAESASESWGAFEEDEPELRDALDFLERTCEKYEDEEEEDEDDDEA